MQRRIMGWREFSVTEAAKDDDRDRRVARRDFITGLGTLAVGTGLAGAIGAGAYRLGKSLLGAPDAKDRPAIMDSPEGSPFTYPDPSTEDGHAIYAAICDQFIQGRPPNPLGITGRMMADAARSAHRDHGAVVPPELALAQLAIEGGVGNPDPDIRPIKTRNPFNVGNVDSGLNRRFRTVEEAIGAYYRVIASKYLHARRPEDLIVRGGFVNGAGNRYASNPAYESQVRSVVGRAKSIAGRVLAGWGGAKEKD